MIFKTKFFKEEASKLHPEAGFTLAELLIVIVLISIMGSLAVTQIMSKFRRAKVDTTKIQMKQLGTILDDYRRECNYYPTSDQGLQALITKPTGGRECKNYDPEGYIKGGKIPKDSWQNEFIYISEGNTYELKSLGNDGLEGGEGYDADISSKDLE